MVLMNLPIGQQYRCRHRKQTSEHSRGREGGMISESSIETYILP